MSFDGQAGGLLPPPLHHSRQGSSSSLSAEAAGSRASSSAPPLPPRPGGTAVPAIAVEDAASSSEDEPTTPVYGASTSTVNLLTPKDEEQLSEVQLRELYDDEEIERFLHLFSTYVREVRAPGSLSSTNVAHAASASAPALSETLPTTEDAPKPSPSHPPTTEDSSPRSFSERVAVDYFLPLLPPPRPPPPEFSLGRLRQTVQRLYVALEPLYSLFAVPLLRLATWQNPRTSFAYCALYWILWYHGLLLSALLLRVLYSLLRRRLHPYPSLDELRQHRTRIDRSHTFGAMLSARLAATPSLGVEDVWHLFKDYRHTRKLKKAAKHAAAVDDAQSDDAASIHSVATEKPEENHEDPLEDLKDEDLKRLGLFALCEVADLLERIKNIFLWRNPSASVFYGAVPFGWFFLALLPAQYLIRSVGFLFGAFYWHIIPILVAVPPSERSRFPPLLSKVPTDTEYAMDLISQRVARGLPVRPKKRRRQRRSSDASISGVAIEEVHKESESSSVDWNKWGDRLASTKERTGEIKKILRDGQWKQAENWKAALGPTSTVVTPQSGPEPRIETHTFPAQLKQHPGLITLTPTTVFFTPLLSSSAALSIPLADVTRVKKGSLMKGIDIHYNDARADGSTEAKEAKFLFVGSRDDLFARLVSWGGKRWTNV